MAKLVPKFKEFQNWKISLNSAFIFQGQIVKYQMHYCITIIIWHWKNPLNLTKLFRNNSQSIKGHLRYEQCCMIFDWLIFDYFLQLMLVVLAWKSVAKSNEKIGHLKACYTVLGCPLMNLLIYEVIKGWTHVFSLIYLQILHGS